MLSSLAYNKHADVFYPDETVSPNKRYDLMDAKQEGWTWKNVAMSFREQDLMNILRHHSEDQSNDSKFLLDRTRAYTYSGMTSRTIFHIPKQMNNNHASFMPLPSFSDMVPFYKQVLGFTMNSLLFYFRYSVWQCRDAYHNLQDDDIMKNIFNSGRNKNKVGMWIPS
ncbi:hypothetical protein Tco_0969227 [Tanacetum coccineum]